MARMFGAIVPGIDARALVSELKDRMAEELDYTLERTSQEAFAAAYDGDPRIAVPKVVDGADKVLVTTWMDGRPLSDIISSGTQTERDLAGSTYLHFLFASPAREGLLHADPHPGNYRMLPDGRLGVLDFGAVARLPGGAAQLHRATAAHCHAGGRRDRRAGPERRGLHPSRCAGGPGAGAGLPGSVRGARRARDVPLHPRVDAEPVQADQRPAAGELVDRAEANLPPEYLLVHRVWLGGVGVLCQLGANVEMRGQLEEWLPGFADA